LLLQFLKNKLIFFSCDKNSWQSPPDPINHNLLLSPMSKLWSTRTPWIHDSRTCAPCWPSWFPFKSRWSPAVDSLHARPSNKCLSASNGILQLAMLRCLRLKLDVKNCLNDGGISLPFFVPKELCDTLRCDKWVEQPLRSAPNSYKNQIQLIS
jgi:hypothetical protein